MRNYKEEKREKAVISKVFSAVIADLLDLWTIKENTDKRHHSCLSCSGAPEYIRWNKLHANEANVLGINNLAF